MSDDFFGFDEGDSDLAPREVEKFKVREGKTERIALMSFRKYTEADAEKGEIPNGKNVGDWVTAYDDDYEMEEYSLNFKKFEYVYIHGLGYVKPTPYLIELAGKKPTVQGGAVILRYATDSRGMLTNEMQPLRGAELMRWDLSRKNFKNLREIHRMTNLSTVDVMVTCDSGGEQYQNLSFLPVQRGKRNPITSYFRKSENITEAEREAMRQEAFGILKDMEKGREVSEEEVKEKLGLTTSEVDDPWDDNDFDDDLDDLGL